MTITSLVARELGNMPSLRTAVVVNLYNDSPRLGYTYQPDRLLRELIRDTHEHVGTLVYIIRQLETIADSAARERAQSICRKEIGDNVTNVVAFGGGFSSGTYTNTMTFEELCAAAKRPSMLDSLLGRLARRLLLAEG